MTAKAMGPELTECFEKLDEIRLLGNQIASLLEVAKHHALDATVEEQGCRDVIQSSAHTIVDVIEMMQDEREA